MKKLLDHKEIGKKLKLFCFSDSVGKGLPLWLPNGAIIREELISFLKKKQSRMGYQGVVSPHIANKKLYQQSGHYDLYKEHAFGEMCCGDESYMLKPMNCPHHCEIFKSEPRSYKELPLKFSEFGQVYRFEDSGAINGLLRARGFCQDDAHIFCRPDQVKKEIDDIIKLVIFVFDKFGFKDYEAQVSLRSRDNKSKYIGSDEIWELAEQSIIEVANDNNLKVDIQEGEAAFYGPKIDFMIKDSLGRKWQLGSIQLDYNLPNRFELEYVNSDGELVRPVMIHRAPFGSLERFIAIMLEECQGNLPFWISPKQVVLIPVSDKYIDYCESLENKLLDSDIRVVIDKRSESVQKRIRNSQMEKIPYMMVIGEKEVNSDILSIRSREGKVDEYILSDFIEQVKK